MLDTAAGGGVPTTLEPQGVNPPRDRGLTSLESSEKAKRRKTALAVTCGQQNTHAGRASSAQSEESSHPNFFSFSRRYILKKKLVFFLSFLRESEYQQTVQALAKSDTIYSLEHSSLPIPHLGKLSRAGPGLPAISSLIPASCNVGEGSPRCQSSPCL